MEELELTYEETKEPTKSSFAIASDITFKNCNEIAYHLAISNLEAAKGLLKELQYYTKDR